MSARPCIWTMPPPPGWNGRCRGQKPYFFDLTPCQPSEFGTRWDRGPGALDRRGHRSPSAGGAGRTSFHVGGQPPRSSNMALKGWRSPWAKEGQASDHVSHRGLSGVEHRAALSRRATVSPCLDVDGQGCWTPRRARKPLFGHYLVSVQTPIRRSARCRYRRVIAKLPGEGSPVSYRRHSHFPRRVR